MISAIYVAASSVFPVAEKYTTRVLPPSVPAVVSVLPGSLGSGAVEDADDSEVSDGFVVSGEEGFPPLQAARLNTMAAPINKAMSFFMLTAPFQYFYS